MQLQRLGLAMFALAATLSAQIPDFTPPTPLIRAIARDQLSEVTRLLDAGADPNEANFMGSSPLVFAIMQQNPEIVRALIKKGADVKSTDAVGSSALMWAAAAEWADADLVDELVRLGVDPNAPNKLGETALTWAMRRGYTPVVEALLRHGASEGPMIRQSVEKALAALQKSGPEFVKVSGCTSCHNQSLPQMAYNLSRQRGFHVDPELAERQKKTVAAMFKNFRQQMLAGLENIPNPSISVTYSLIGLGAEGYAADETTDAMAHLVSVQQEQDGSFRTFRARPPMESNKVSGTALSVRALQLYGKNPEAQIERARAWLRTAEPRTNEERSMKLLGLYWAKGSPEDMQTAARALLAEQRPDGGWAQLPALESDAYATGQAMIALLSAGQLRASDPACRRAVAFLLRTQHEDGTWLVRSRVFPFQPYKESGFPHGKHQWISAAGTSWAVMALTMTLPESNRQISQVF